MPIDSSTDLITAYYETWKNGIDSFDEAGLRAMLAPDFVYEGPIAGRRPGADSFVRGLRGFTTTLRGFHLLSELHVGEDAALLYDCDVSQPAGTFRFAEFLHIDHGKIQSVRLVFDATEFRKAAASAN
jgi:ketosteroid isomerase-like protein